MANEASDQGCASICNVGALNGPDFAFALLFALGAAPAALEGLAAMMFSVPQHHREYLTKLGAWKKNWLP